MEAEIDFTQDAVRDVALRIIQTTAPLLSGVQDWAEVKVVTTQCRLNHIGAMVYGVNIIVEEDITDGMITFSESVQVSDMVMATDVRAAREVRAQIMRAVEHTAGATAAALLLLTSSQPGFLPMKQVEDRIRKSASIATVLDPTFSDISFKLKYGRVLLGDTWHGQKGNR